MFGTVARVAAGAAVVGIVACIVAEMGGGRWRKHRNDDVIFEISELFSRRNLHLGLVGEPMWSGTRTRSADEVSLRPGEPAVESFNGEPCRNEAILSQKLVSQL